VQVLIISPLREVFRKDFLKVIELWEKLEFLNERIVDERPIIVREELLKELSVIFNVYHALIVRLRLLITLELKIIMSTQLFPIISYSKFS